MDNTRQMPNAIEAENAIIGALLIDSNAYKEIDNRGTSRSDVIERLRKRSY